MTTATTGEWDCTHRGHHYHEPDGKVFVRHRLRNRENLIDLHCCHCLTTAQAFGYASLTSPPSMDDVARASAGCGPHKDPPWAVPTPPTPKP